MHNEKHLKDKAYKAIYRIANARGWAQVRAGQDPDEPEQAIRQVLLDLWCETERPSSRIDAAPGTGKTAFIERFLQARSQQHAMSQPSSVTYIDLFDRDQKRAGDLG